MDSTQKVIEYLKSQLKERDDSINSYGENIRASINLSFKKAKEMEQLRKDYERVCEYNNNLNDNYGKLQSYCKELQDKIK